MTSEIYPGDLTASPQPKIRDFQVSRVYRAGDYASRALLGRVWTQTLNEEEVVAFMNTVVKDPNVVARWGEKDVGVSFEKRKNLRYAGSYPDGDGNHIFLPYSACNEVLILHELAHCYEVSKPEAIHGMGFAAVWHYLFANAFGAKAGEILLRGYKLHKVKFDYSLIPDKTEPKVELEVALTESPAPEHKLYLPTGSGLTPQFALV